MLSIRKLSLTGVFLLLLIAGCNKDMAPIESGSDVNTLVRLNWNQTEKQFFNFFNQSKVAKNDLKLSFRSGLTNVPPLLAEAYNQIARENDLHSFVDDLTRKIGIPFWLNAYVNMENLEGDGMVIIPFGFEEGKRVEALLVGIKSPELPHNYFHFEFVLRRDIDQMVRQNTVPDNRPNLFLELAHFIYDDAKIYQMMNGNLKNYIDQNLDLIDQIDGENMSGLRSCRYIRMVHCLSDGSSTYLDDWYNENGGNDEGEGWVWVWNPYWGSEGDGYVESDNSGGGGGDDEGDGGIEDGNTGNGGWNWWKNLFKPRLINKKPRYYEGECWSKKALPLKNPYIPQTLPKKLEILNEGDHLRNFFTDCIIYYQKFCEDGNGGWYEVSLDEIDVCHQAMDNFLYQYDLNLDSETIDFLMSQMNQGLCYDQEAFGESTLTNLAIYLHNDLLATIPNYSLSNVNINEFINTYGAEKYIASAILYEHYMNEIGDEPIDDPYKWQLAMEVFRDELLPILLEFTPGIGDLIGAFNDFQDGNYFWACVGIISSIVPGDEIIKVIRKADNIRDAWRKVDKIFTLWNKLFTLPGGQKILNKLPQNWKNLPGSKLADGNGLKWVMPNNGPHFRIMDANPAGQISQQVPYGKFWKNGSFIDINGKPVSGNSPEAHIPLSQITDSFLDNFFN